MQASHHEGNSSGSPASPGQRLTQGTVFRTLRGRTTLPPAIWLPSCMAMRLTASAGQTRSTALTNVGALGGKYNLIQRRDLFTASLESRKTSSDKGLRSTTLSLCRTIGKVGSGGSNLLGVHHESSPLWINEVTGINTNKWFL